MSIEPISNSSPSAQTPNEPINVARGAFPPAMNPVLGIVSGFDPGILSQIDPSTLPQWQRQKFDAEFIDLLTQYEDEPEGAKKDIMREELRAHCFALNEWIQPASELHFPVDAENTLLSLALEFGYQAIVEKYLPQVDAHGRAEMARRALSKEQVETALFIMDQIPIPLPPDFRQNVLLERESARLWFSLEFGLIFNIDEDDLYRAAELGHIKAISRFLDTQFIYVTAKCMVKILDHAVSNRQYAVVDAILSRGNCFPEAVLKATYTAAQQGDTWMVHQLMSSPSFDKNPPIERAKLVTYAAMGRNANLVDILAKYVIGILPQSDQQGILSQALFNATFTNDLNTVQILCGYVEDKNRAFFASAVHGQHEIFRFLSQFATNFQAAARSAATMGHADIVLNCIDRGAEILEPLYTAIEHGQENVVGALKDRLGLTQESKRIDFEREFAAVFTQGRSKLVRFFTLHLSPECIGNLLQMVAERRLFGSLESIEMLISCSKLRGIDKSVIERALISAVQSKNIRLICLLVENYKDFSRQCIEKTLVFLREHSSRSAAMGIVNLTACPEFQNVHEDIVGTALLRSFRDDQSISLRALLPFTNSKYLNVLFITSADNRSTIYLNDILQSNLVNESSFPNALEIACTNRDLPFIEALLASPRFVNDVRSRKDVYIALLSNALHLAVDESQTEVVRALVALDVIPVSELNSAFKRVPKDPEFSAIYHIVVSALREAAQTQRIDLDWCLEKGNAPIIASQIENFGDRFSPDALFRAFIWAVDRGGEADIFEALLQLDQFPLKRAMTLIVDKLIDRNKGAFLFPLLRQIADAIERNEGACQIDHRLIHWNQSLNNFHLVNGVNRHLGKYIPQNPYS